MTIQLAGRSSDTPTPESGFTLSHGYVLVLKHAR